MKNRKRIFWLKVFGILFAFPFTYCSSGSEDDNEAYSAPSQEVTVTASDFTTNLDENPQVGVVIGTVQASTNSGSVRFSIVSQSDAGAINIDATSGQISVADASLFDFEARTIITAVIEVSSGSTSREITVTINLQDVSEVDLSSLTLWEGEKTTFTKANEANPSLAENQDRITENVWITRGDQGVLYNANIESTANNTSSPADTEWAQGTFADLAAIQFSSFRAACPGEKPKNVVGIPMVLHLIQDDIYIEITITSWAQGKLGGFTYQRSTP